MSKHDSHAEGKAEHKHDAKHEGKAEAKTEHKKQEHKSEHKEDKKPGAPAGGPAGHGGHAAPTATPKGKGKGHEPIAGHCSAWSCKAKSTTFNFCPEHFDHFKFGLLKKTGEPVSDYERKFEHYTAYLTQQRARKVA